MVLKTQKITETVVLVYKGAFRIDTDTGAAWASYHPVIEYYNEFLNKKVQNKLLVVDLIIT